MTYLEEESLPLEKRFKETPNSLLSALHRIESFEEFFCAMNKKLKAQIVMRAFLLTITI
jgi:hypothetical protein